MQFGGECDLLIALHAKRSAPSVAQFHDQFPDRRLIVAITGTDLYRDGQQRVTQQTLRLADKLIVLQEATRAELTTTLRRKTHVIHQSAAPLQLRRPLFRRAKPVLVAGHLRTLKDPLRAAYAVRHLPASSQIIVHHYGGVLEPAWLPRVEAEDRRNDRYQWHGEIPRYALRRKLAQSWLTVLSSRMEGGANVLTEAIVNGTPALTTRISGSMGILGAAYEGYFDVADTQGLSRLLRQCEEDPAFYQQLADHVQQRASLFRPAQETQAWRKLLAELRFDEARLVARPDKK